MSWLPTVAEERADALRPNSSGWKRHGIVLATVFFFLTVLGVAALYALLHKLHVPDGVPTAVVAIALAEWLIQGRRFFGTGIESALWIGGLFAFIFSLPSSGKPEALLVFAAAFAIAGVRMRSAIFGTAAVIVILAYIVVKTEVGWPPLAFGIAVAALAAMALLREWRRPSTELLMGMLMVIMPIAAEIAWLEKDKGRVPLQRDCRLGYRAKTPHALATGIEDGSIDLARIADPSQTTEELFESYRAAGHRPVRRGASSGHGRAPRLHRRRHGVPPLRARALSQGARRLGQDDAAALFEVGTLEVSGVLVGALGGGPAGGIGAIVYACGAPFEILTAVVSCVHCEGTVDDKIKQLLRELGTAINESISSSEDVNKYIQRIRDEGYDLYVVLDATIGLNKHDSEDQPAAEQPSTELIVKSDKEVQFRINVNDLALLRALGIDPTRKVRNVRRVAALPAASEE